MQRNDTIAVVGLGYVGLPLAVAFSRKRRVIGFDVNAEKLSCINKELMLQAKWERSLKIIQSSSQQIQQCFPKHPSSSWQYHANRSTSQSRFAACAECK